jgi:hypothetical protein
VTSGQETLGMAGWAGGVLVVASMFIAEFGPRRCCDALSPRVECCRQSSGARHLPQLILPPTDFSRETLGKRQRSRADLLTLNSRNPTTRRRRSIGFVGVMRGRSRESLVMPQVLEHQGPWRVRCNKDGCLSEANRMSCQGCPGSEREPASSRASAAGRSEVSQIWRLYN